MPGECPLFVGWGVRVAAVLTIAAVSLFVALRWTRPRAIFCSLWFGLMPWWVYEGRPHYDCGYLAHLRLNLRYAWTWATWRETLEEEAFERRVNARPNWIRGLRRGPQLEREQIVDAHNSTYTIRDEAP